MNRLTILVVEDDRAVRSLITTTLKANEYHFLTAKDGENFEAVKTAAEESITSLFSGKLLGKAV